MRPSPGALHVLIAALFGALTQLTEGLLEPARLSTAAAAGWPAFLGGLALTVWVSGLSWAPDGPGYSRYLPRETGHRAVVTAVTLCGALPAGRRRQWDRPERAGRVPGRRRVYLMPARHSRATRLA